MRENNKDILFRGKRLDNGQWILGYVMFRDNNEAVMVRQNKRTGHLEDVDIDPNTIGRYFCKDKIGGYVFEGDIIGTTASQQIMLLSFENGCITGRPYNNLENPGIIIRSNTITQNSRVLGNRYDNPELLTATKTELETEVDRDI